MAKRSRQLTLLKPGPKSYGGDLLKTRKGRAQGRPLAIRNSIHLVLRSSQAKGEWSFRRQENRKRVELILAKFSMRHNIRILSFANVGNHLHLQIQLSQRETYFPFIRAVTGAVAMAVTGVNRWAKCNSKPSLRFWDYRPFTRVVMGYRALLTLKDYIRINEWEGFGVNRRNAEFIIKGPRWSSA